MAQLKGERCAQKAVGICTTYAGVLREILQRTGILLTQNKNYSSLGDDTPTDLVVAHCAVAVGNSSKLSRWTKQTIASVKNLSLPLCRLFDNELGVEAAKRFQARRRIAADGAIPVSATG